jgi:glycosyltransferase involved in cell wall biosynthesis
MRAGHRLHQVIAAATPGDAVTGQALRWRDRLRAWGCASEIVAEHVHPALEGDVLRLDRAGGGALAAADGILIHYSIWSRVVEAALAAAAPLGVIYHNVTPGDLLRAANPDVAAMCDKGRRMLGRLQGRVRVLIADSAFNARDLAAAGLGPAEVVPLLIDPVDPCERTEPLPADPVIITVGRIAPNKRIEDAIRVTALLQRSGAPGTRLLVVGADDSFEAYGAALRVLVERLAVHGVRFTGRVGDGRRDALYHEATAYLCMSVHEGFCMPVVEAMQHGLPVVARSAGAVPETLAGAGIVLPDDDLAVFAEAVREASASGPLRRALAVRARRRLAELAPERIDRRMRAALAPLLETE